MSITLTVPLRITVELGAPAADGGQPQYFEADAEAVERPRAEDYANRGGYEPDFLGNGAKVPLPRVTREAEDVLEFDLDGKTEQELRYQHFSVLMSRSRRLCRFSAVNVDGGRSKKVKRSGWKMDPRIPSDAQISKECY